MQDPTTTQARRATRKSKLQTLAESEGYQSPEDFLEASAFDSVVYGICTNPGCDYTTEVEPDCSRGYCEACGTNTVASGLILAGII